MSNFQSFFFECASEFRSICGLFLANQLMEWKWLDFQVKTPILMRLSAVCVMCFSRYFFIVMKIEPFFKQSQTMIYIYEKPTCSFDCNIHFCPWQLTGLMAAHSHLSISRNHKQMLKINAMKCLHSKWLGKKATSNDALHKKIFCTEKWRKNIYINFKRKMEWYEWNECK